MLRITFILVLLLSSDLLYAQPGLASTYYVLAESGLNMRSEPNLKSKVIAKIPYGESVTDPDYTDEGNYEGIEDFPGYHIYDYWIKCNYKGKVGYVFKGYLSRYRVPKADEGMQEYLTRLFGHEKTEYMPNQGYHNEEEVEPCARLIVHADGNMSGISNCSEGGTQYQYILGSFSKIEAYLLMKLIFTDMNIAYDEDERTVIFGNPGEVGCTYELDMDDGFIPTITGYCGC